MIMITLNKSPHRQRRHGRQTGAPGVIDAQSPPCAAHVPRSLPSSADVRTHPSVKPAHDANSFPSAPARRRGGPDGGETPAEEEQ